MTPSAAVPNPVTAAAAELFIERGYQGTSVSDIARRAQVSVGTVYNNFPGKAQILLEVFRHYDARQEERTRDAVASARSAGVQDVVNLFVAATHGYLLGVWRERHLSRLFTTIDTTSVDLSSMTAVQQSWPGRNAHLLGLESGTVRTQAAAAAVTGAVGGWIRDIQRCTGEEEALAYIAQVSLIEQKMLTAILTDT